jgi:hypothetical protein
MSAYWLFRHAAAPDPKFFAFSMAPSLLLQIGLARRWMRILFGSTIGDAPRTPC